MQLPEILRDAPDIWRIIVQTMDEALIFVSPTRRILFCNEKAERLIGQPLAQVQGKECVEALNCPQCQCVCKLFDEGVVKGTRVTVFSADGESRIFLKNGRVLRDAAGDVIGGIETFADITQETCERQDKEKRIDLLFRERNRTAALLDSLSEGVFSIDCDLQVRDFSRRMSEITGYGRDQALGADLFELLGLARPDRLCCDALFEGQVRGEIRCADGSFKPVEITFRPVRFATDEALGLLRDLSPPPGTPCDIDGNYSFHGIISRTPQMRELFRLVEAAAASDFSVLIEGESGTGKELVARAVHRLSPRRTEPFYAVNCATFTGSLLLSELFGHERGAFTGAVASKKGKLELAGRGSLFLDEVSEIPLEHQALLLRVLEERSFERLGSSTTQQIEARIVAATNRRLEEAVEEGRFRKDLYYRLKVIPVRVPPLRERPDDIELLARYFLRRCVPQGTGIRFGSDLLEVLRAYGWPGNVRELRNLVEYLCVVCQGDVGVEDLPEEIRAPTRPQPPALERQPLRPDGCEDDRRRLLEALERARYNKAHAAKLLGIHRATLWRRLQKFGL